MPVGPMVADRPPLALHKVRYYGEPIALVVADTEHLAKQAAQKIHVTYKPLSIVQSPKEAFQQDAPLIHEQLGNYEVQVEGVHAIPGTNIANQTKIRKGTSSAGWDASDIIIEETLSPHATLLTSPNVEQMLRHLHLGPGDSVVIMTHDFQKDREILSHLSMNRNLDYIGILGPRKRTKRLIQETRIPEVLHSPVGIDIGAEGPAEIAISIIAGLLQAHRRANVNPSSVTDIANDKKRTNSL